MSEEADLEEVAGSDRGQPHPKAWQVRAWSAPPVASRRALPTFEVRENQRYPADPLPPYDEVDQTDETAVDGKSLLLKKVRKSRRLSSLADRRISTSASTTRSSQFNLPLRIKTLRVHLEHELQPSEALVHKSALALRHADQSAEGSTPIAHPTTILSLATSEGTVGVGSLEVVLFLADLPSDSYDFDEPGLPVAQRQRSDLLYRYSLSTLSGRHVLDAFVPLSKDRQVVPAGTARSRKNGKGGYVEIEWKFDVSKAQRDLGDVHGVRADLEARLQAFEREWREEVADRELARQALAAACRDDPRPDLPNGFATTTGSLIPGLDDVGPCDGSTSRHQLSVPSFDPVPRYSHVDYISRAKPWRGAPFETFPTLPKWESDRSAHRFVADVAAEIMTYVPKEDDTQEKILEEEQWQADNLVSRDKLDGLDPGRVRRDFAALEEWFETLGIDSDELGRRVASANSLPEEVFLEDPALAKMVKVFEGELGTSLSDVQSAFRLLSERGQFPDAEPISCCLMCGNTFCTIHPFEQGDTHRHPKPKLELGVVTDRPSAPSAACRHCGLTDCSSGKFSSRKRDASDDKRLEKLLRIGVEVDMATASLILQRPCDEIAEQSPRKFPSSVVEKPLHAQGRRAISVTHEEVRAPGNSGGYDPCECKGTCDADCRCDLNGGYCDWYCDCSETYCANRAINDQEQKATQLATSENPNAGFGLVMLERANEGDLIGLYGAEQFSLDSDYFDANGYGCWKEAWSDRVAVSYWFNLDKRHAADSDLTGNNSRYINHRPNKKTNSVASVMYIEGTHQIAIYALKNLAPGDEVWIDYGEKYFAEWNT
ncbi:hypothetical protein JCM10212_007117 [Sporobolomyces blumeae]